jgi:hypothetical protein
MRQVMLPEEMVPNGPTEAAKKRTTAGEIEDVAAANMWQILDQSLVFG